MDYKSKGNTQKRYQTLSNARGEGHLFSIDLLDSSAEIRATFFKEACDNFFGLLQEGKVVCLHKLSVCAIIKRCINLCLFLVSF